MVLFCGNSKGARNHCVGVMATRQGGQPHGRTVALVDWKKKAAKQIVSYATGAEAYAAVKQAVGEFLWTWLVWLLDEAVRQRTRDWAGQGVLESAVDRVYGNLLHRLHPVLAEPNPPIHPIPIRKVPSPK